MKLLKPFFILIFLIFYSFNINAADYSISAPITESDTSMQKASLNIVKNSTNEEIKTDYNIENVEQWNEFATKSLSLNNVNVNILSDLDFNNVNNIITATINDNVVVNGNNHTLKNLNLVDKSLILKNNGYIKNLNFYNVSIKNSYYSSIIKENFNTISNISFDKVNLKGIKYVGLVAKNYNKIEYINLNNITSIGDYYVGILTAYNSSIYNVQNKISHTSISNVKGYNLKLYSNNFINKKTYRDIHHSSSNASKDVSGDYFGVISGKNHNSEINNITLNKINIYADDYIGGVTGLNHYTDNYTKQAANIVNINISNFYALGGKRIGGLVGYSVDYRNVSLNTIDPYKNNYKSLKSIVSNVKITHDFYMSGYSEVGGVVGLNYFALVENTSVSINKKSINLYSWYDEGAGLVADNEFGFISNSSTNISSKTRVFQGAGLVADNEGSIINSKSYGNVFTPKEAGGFVGSNFGKIVNSKAYGNVYVTKKYKKIIKKKNSKKVYQKTKKKYYYVTKYYPFYAGNFSAYNSTSKYKGFKLVGTISNSYYANKRYLNSVKLTNLKNGMFGK